MQFPRIMNLFLVFNDPLIELIGIKFWFVVNIATHFELLILNTFELIHAISSNYEFISSTEVYRLVPNAIQLNCDSVMTYWFFEWVLIEYNNSIQAY